MDTCWAKTCIAASLFAVAAQGETLYQRDRITLEGIVRLVTRGAGFCPVSESRHPPDVYEDTNGNHRQPLHVWRLDFDARNGSGRRLEHLTAYLKINSQWPPCTNWTGLGQYPGPVQWHGSFETLQKVDGLAPSAQRAGRVFVLAIDRSELRFWRRQPDYGSAGGFASAPDVPHRAGAGLDRPARGCRSARGSRPPRSTSRRG